MFEDPTLVKDGESTQVVAPSIPTPIEAFNHWQSLYVKYIQIFRKLEECYDSMVNTQSQILTMYIIWVYSTHLSYSLNLLRTTPRYLAAASEESRYKENAWVPLM